MKNLKLSILAAMLVSVFTGVTLAQPATTATTFRMYNSATSYVDHSATSPGIGKFLWPAPTSSANATGIFKSTYSLVGTVNTGTISIGKIDVTTDITPGATNSVLYSSSPTTVNWTAAPPATDTNVLVSILGGAPFYSNIRNFYSKIDTNILNIWWVNRPIQPVSFNKITSGVNNSAQTMTVGSTSILNTSGTGIIAANQFIGSGSTSTAVDLGTGEVNGTLGIANGGTNNTVLGPVGSLAYSDGSKYNFTNAPPPVVNSILVSINGSFPTWSTTNIVPISFDKITSGVNLGQTLEVGGGTTIKLSGGAVQASQFYSNSITPAVDLNSVWNGVVGEVAGTLGTANGGTNATVLGPAGSVAYSDGTRYTFTAVGAAGNVLTSNAGGAPTWANPSSVSGVVTKGQRAGDNVSWSYTITPTLASPFTTIPATAVIMVTLESGTNMPLTVTGRPTTTSFTVSAPVILTTSDIIDYVIFNN